MWTLTYLTLFYLRELINFLLKYYIRQMTFILINALDTHYLRRCVTFVVMFCSFLSLICFRDRFLKLYVPIILLWILDISTKRNREQLNLTIRGPKIFATSRDNRSLKTSSNVSTDWQAVARAVASFFFFFLKILPCLCISPIVVFDKVMAN